MKLKLGFMKSQELAQWFNISYSNYRKNAVKKLKLLSNYCEYKKVWGGVQIKKIYEDTYNPDFTIYTKIYLDQIMKTDEGLSTFAGMTRKRKKQNDDLNNVLYNTEYNRLRKAGNLAFGQINKDTKIGQGLFGMKRYVWAIRLDQFNHYRSLTYEERELYKSCTKEICAENVERVMQGMLLNQAYKSGEMTKEEFLQAQEQYGTNLFPEIRDLFLMKTGYKLECVQQHMVNDDIKNKFYNRIA